MGKDIIYTFVLNGETLGPNELPNRSTFNVTMQHVEVSDEAIFIYTYLSPRLGHVQYNG